MSVLSGRFQQTISENKRYMLDYTAQLASGETVTAVAVAVTCITNPAESPAALVVNNVAIAPAGNQVVFFVSAGTDLASYEVQFIATTSLTQKWEDVVEFDLVDKV